MLNIARGNEIASSVSRIALVGEMLRSCPSFSGIDRLRLPKTSRGHVSHGAAVACAVCLAALGQNDYADLEGYAGAPVFVEAVVGRLPSEETCRQRIGQLGADGRALGVLDDVVVELLRGVDPGRVEVGGRKLVVLDIDVSVMAEPCSEHKEGVGWTYKGENGYAPIFAYLGTKGYALAAELRPGTQHCSKEALPFLRRCVALAGRLGFAPEELLVRVDSGHDDREFLAELQKMGVRFIVKRNFRREDQEGTKTLAKGSGRKWHDVRDWSTVRASLDEGESEKRFGVNGIRQVAELAVKRADRNGQPLLIPEEELDCWWTNLDCSADTCVRLYYGHGTSEQYHAELKSDMRLERLPGGKMGANAVTLACGMLALDCLRLIGRHALDHARRRRGVPKRLRLRLRLRMRARTVIDTMPGSRGMSSGTREPSRSGSARPSGTSRRSSGCSSDVVCNERITEQRSGFLHPRHPGRGGGGASQKTRKHDRTRQNMTEKFAGR